MISAKFIRYSVLLVLLVVVLSKLHPEQFMQYLSVNFLLCALLLQPLVLINLIISAKRFQYMAVPDKEVGLPLFIRVMILSCGLNFVLPGRLAELIKPTFLSEHANIGYAHLLAALTLEKLYDLQTIGLLIILLVAYHAVNSMMLLWLTIGVTSTVLLFLLPYMKPIINMFVRCVPTITLRTLITNSYNHSYEILKKRSPLPIFILSILAWLVMLMIFWCFVFLAAGIKLSLIHTVMLLVCAIVGGAVPLLPAGFGLFEAGAIYALSRAGFDFNHALGLAIGLHLTLIGVLPIMAYYYSLKYKTGVSKLVLHLKNKKTQSAIS